MARPKIALYGVFGIQNLGNECTLLAMRHNVQRRLPGAEVYSICYEPADTIRRHGLRAVPISRRHTEPGTCTRAAANTLARLARAIVRTVPREVRDWIRAFKTLRGTDLLLMTGTGMLTDYSTSAFGYPYDVLKWTLAARLAGCKVRFVGIGVGPVYRRLSRRFFKAALSQADYRSYRDTVSRARLEELGFATATDVVVPDLAFSLPKRLFPHDRPHDTPRLVVGVGVMRHVDVHAIGCQSRPRGYEAYLDEMARFVAWLVERGYGVRILQGDARHDVAVRRDLRATLQRRGLTYEGAGIVDEDSESVTDLVTQLAATDVVVSPRFHNLILALMLGKPVISISYDAKNDALLEQFGLGRYCHSIETVTAPRLIEHLTELEHDLEQRRAALRRRTERYRSLLDQQYRTILAGI